MYAVFSAQFISAALAEQGIGIIYRAACRAYLVGGRLLNGRGSRLWNGSRSFLLNGCRCFLLNRCGCRCFLLNGCGCRCNLLNRCRCRLLNRCGLLYRRRSGLLYRCGLLHRCRLLNRLTILLRSRLTVIRIVHSGRAGCRKIRPAQYSCGTKHRKLNKTEDKLENYHDGVAEIKPVRDRHAYKVHQSGDERDEREKRNI